MHIVEAREPGLIQQTQIQIATASSKFSIQWNNKQLTVAEFRDMLAKPAITKETLAQFKAMTKGQQDNIKDVGGYVGGLLKDGRRNRQSVANRSLLTLDLDSAGGVPPEEILERMADALPSVAQIIHSTHKHERSAPRLRWIVFLSRVVLPDEYQAIARKVVSKINMEWFDDTTYEPARLMYWPSVPTDAEYLFIDQTDDEDGKGGDGERKQRVLLDVDAVLAEYGEGDAWKDSSLWPTSSRQDAVIQRHIAKQQNPLTKAGVVGAFCRVFNIHEAIEKFLSDTYRREGEGRYTYTDGSSSKGLVVYGVDAPGQEALWAYSHHSTDPARGVLCNAFDLVRLHYYADQDEDAKPNTPTYRLPSYIAMSELAERTPAAKDENLKVSLGFSNLDEEEGEGGDGEEGGRKLADWMRKLQINKKTKAVMTHLPNLIDFLVHDEKYKDAFCYNEFSYQMEMGRGNEIKEVHIVQIVKDIHNRYGLTFSRSDCEGAVLYACKRNSYHPVREYLDGLPKWDGVPRVMTLFVDYFGEEDTIYTRQIALLWMVAAVDRAYTPGTKFDHCIVVSGQQGVGKSTFCRVLAKKWSGELSSFEDNKNRYDADWNSTTNALPDAPGTTEVRDRVCVAEIWEDCLKQRVEYKRTHGRRISAIMDKLCTKNGWKRTATIRFGARFGRQMGWMLYPNEAPF